MPPTGILLYFQKQLIRSTFEGCILLLTSPPPAEEVDEKFWDVYNKVAVDVKEFNRLFEYQTKDFHRIRQQFSKRNSFV